MTLNVQLEAEWAFAAEWSGNFKTLSPFTRQKNRVQTHRKSDTNCIIFTWIILYNGSDKKWTMFEWLYLHYTFSNMRPLYCSSDQRDRYNS